MEIKGQARKHDKDERTWQNKQEMTSIDGLKDKMDKENEGHGIDKGMEYNGKCGKDDNIDLRRT